MHLAPNQHVFGAWGWRRAGRLKLLVFLTVTEGGQRAQPPSPLPAPPPTKQWEGSAVNQDKPQALEEPRRQGVARGCREGASRRRDEGGGFSRWVGWAERGIIAEGGKRRGRRLVARVEEKAMTRPLLAWLTENQKMDKEGAGYENQGWPGKEALGQFLRSPAFQA